MLRDLIDQASREFNLPEVIAERCIHSLAEIGTCMRCADACPKDAWVITDDMLGIDAELCDACGLCAPACPQAAIVNNSELAYVETQMVKLAVARCQSVFLEEEFPEKGVMPCIHSIGLRGLAKLVSNGVQCIAACSADCDRCERSGADRIDQQIEFLNQLLSSRELPNIEIFYLDVAKWQSFWRNLHPDEQGESVSRRFFLRRGLSQLRNKILDESYLSDSFREAPLTATQLLPSTCENRLAEVSPLFIEESCNGCDACINLCPQHALALLDDGLSYAIEPERCTGCGLCVDVCDQNAISLVNGGLSKSYRVQLKGGNCQACGAPFHRPDIEMEDANLCRVCQKHNHYKSLYQVI